MEDTHTRLLGIGDLARASGLPVSALRFYDAQGLLAPVDVDPRTGYRRYAPEQVRTALVVAHLRRIGMPLADVAELLGAAFGPDPDRSLADLVLDRHVRRLQDGLAAALTESSRVRTLLDEETSVTTQTQTTVHTVHVRPGDLAAAIDATRYALSPTPSVPVLSGALLELDGDVLRLVGTDRYRLAVGEAPLREPLPGAGAAGPVQVLVPTPVLDQLRSRLDARPGEAEVEVSVVDTAHGGGRVRVSIEGQEPLESDGVEAEFPAYRRLLPAAQRHQVSVDVAALRRAVAAAPTEQRRREQDDAEYELVVLWVGEDGVEVGPAGAGQERAVELAVNRGFLLEALDALEPSSSGSAAAGQLVLGVDGPPAPLALRLPAAERPAALLMPVRRD